MKGERGLEKEPRPPVQKDPGKGERQDESQCPLFLMRVLKKTLEMVPLCFLPHTPHFSQLPTMQPRSPS